jgi:hypothetical protein
VIPLAPHASDLLSFVDALFRYADVGTFVSWRAFRDDTKDAPPVFIAGTPVPDERAIAQLAATALAAATDAANHPFPAVFCPPIATFTSETRAREVDLANGLALSIECDEHPGAARATLELLLGPATVVVESGGVTGDGDAKLHLHWRLSEPTSEPSDHARLKRARILATALAGGDATNVPAVHPIRWPGSVHRKGEPRLARIIALAADRELDLADTLERLELAVPQRATSPASPSAPTGDVAPTSELVAELLSGSSIHAPLVALAYRYLRGGMHDAHVVLTLRGLMDAIPTPARNRPDQPERWAGHYRDIPRTVRTAREKLQIEGAPPPSDLSPFLAELSAPAFIHRVPDVIKEIPAELLQPPGILSDVMQYGIDSAVRPVAIFAVQAALALASVVCGRRYMTSQRNYSSLYFLNVAKSGTGKEEAKTTIERILSAAGSRRLLAGSSYSSGNAVFSALLKKPQHLTILDEFGKYLEAASGERDSFKSDALTQLMEAFGRVHGDMATPQFSTMTLSPSAAANHEPRIIARPAITLLAMTTPSTFYATMRSTRILDGFLNRFLVVEHQGPRTPMAEWKDVAVPDRVVDWVKQILKPHGDMDLGTQTDTIGPPRLVEMTDAKLDATRLFEREMITLSESLEADGLGDMPIRAREIAMRLGLICALADTPDTPIVTVDCFEWAATYVRFFLLQTIEALRSRVADSATERTRNQILLAIRLAGERGVTNRELNRGKAFIGIPRRDRAEAIESLLAAELVAWVDVAIPERGGRPRRALVGLGEAETGGKQTDAILSGSLSLVS